MSPLYRSLYLSHLLSLSNRLMSSLSIAIYRSRSSYLWHQLSADDVKLPVIAITNRSNAFIFSLQFDT